MAQKKHLGSNPLEWIKPAAANTGAEIARRNSTETKGIEQTAPGPDEVLALREEPVIRPPLKPAMENTQVNETPREARKEKNQSEKPYYMVPLSANTEDALDQKVLDMIGWLEKEGTGSNIEDIAYTLHLRRSHFPVRMAVIAKDAAELKDRLAEFKDSRHVKGCLFNNLKDTSLMHDSFSERKGAELVNELASSNLSDGEYFDKLEALAGLFVKGVRINWEDLYTGIRCRCISLPTYPFSRDRYWIYDGKEAVAKVPAGSAEKLHPLIGKNISDLEEQKYCVKFDGTEFFLAHHVIGSNKMLPGAACLEMARAAGELAGNRAVKKIKSVYWEAPFIIDEKIVREGINQVYISLYSGTDCVEYEIWSAGENGGRICHSLGELAFENGATGAEREALGIESIKSRCSSFRTGKECYELFEAAGIYYGSAFRCLKELYAGEGECLSRLELPPELVTGFDRYLLHPSLLDGALQTVIGLTAGKHERQGVPYVPFSMGELDIAGSMGTVCYAYVKFKNGEPGSSAMKYDIYIADEEGYVNASIKDFTARALKQELPEIGSVAYRFRWKRNELTQYIPEKLPEGSILIFDHDGRLRNLLAEKTGNERIVLVKPGDVYKCLDKGVYEINPQHPEDYKRLVMEICPEDKDSLNILHLWAGKQTETDACGLKSAMDAEALSVLYICQALFEQRAARQAGFLYIYPGSEDVSRPHNSAVAGMVKSINLENPRFGFKIIGLYKDFRDRLNDAADILMKEMNSLSAGVEEVLWNGDGRFTRTMEECPIENDGGASCFKDGGVYLITGGAGGLGLIFAEYMARKAKVNLVLTGRSALGPESQKRIRDIGASGSNAVYMKCDISDPASVRELLSKIRDAYKRIDGVIHCAGVLRDSLVINKKKPEIEEVLEPKVYGTLVLDEATEDEALDFFVMFSSFAAVSGNVGQADYAYANSFMDHFAEMRASMVQKGMRSGKTLAVNWPLWSDGGMKAGKENETLMKERFGLLPVNSGNGARLLEYALGTGESRLAILYGNKAEIRRLVKAADKGSRMTDTGKSASLDETDKERIRKKTEEYLKNLFSAQIKLPASKILSDDPLEKYGIDSVLIISLTREMEKTFGELPKTLLFEYRSLGELAKYFAENHTKTIMEKLAVPLDKPANKPLRMKEEIRQSETRHAARTRTGRRRFFEAGTREPGFEKQEDVAIIGISGRYPMADNLDAFWENLKEGRDCITEIPEDRWDHGFYLGSGKGKPGFIYSKWGGFIDGVDRFDPLFFNISPREAELMEPQERLFLETVWHTLEDAGYTKASLSKNKVGVFVGAMYSHYQILGAEESLKGNFVAPSPSNASIANRISYYFDFNGPSITIDTMCSSSLTAIHLACASLQKGEIDVAVAGGVNVTIHPSKYIMLNKNKFASSDGRCRSFGEGGDGYVPGEGTGAVLLKPLSKALADKDRIYAVIKASTLNHGGKTNGYTVPNLSAQAELILEAIKKAKINPRKISYIEAHGTGTSLGDPIEISGLVRAFRKYTGDRQFCSIGSVKSNIGHLESAAGIAAITKVILQMKNKMLVPSIHAEKLNPNINFEESPFRVQRELEKWKQPVYIENGREEHCPRYAGISSFGAGGSNAHIILEEWTEHQPRGSDTEMDPQVVILSARNNDRLKAFAGLLADFLKASRPGDGVSLEDLAYTLQVGREAMEERLAFVAGSIGEIYEKLDRFACGSADVEGVFRGNARQSRLEGFIGDEAGEAYINIVIGKRKYEKLAQLWVSGIDIDWKLLYQGKTPRRISLPGYPFARERYWITTPADSIRPNAKMYAKKLHPLIDSNVSDLEEQKYLLQLAGDEFFLTDHMIGRRKVLPGAAYFEMARAACELAGNRKVKAIKNTVWLKPIEVDNAIPENGTKDVYISLYPCGDWIEYEVWTEDPAGGRIIHAQGELVFEEPGEGRDFGKIDAGSIRKRCTNHLKGEECYAKFSAMGIDYGPAFRSIKDLYYGNGESFACIELPELPGGEHREFLLHPSVVDGALQAMIGAAAGGRVSSGAPYLPFSAGRVDILEAPARICHAYVRRSDSTSGGFVEKYDIVVAGIDGTVFVRIENFAVRALHREAASENELLMFTCDWEHKPVAAAMKEDLREEMFLVFDTGNRMYDSIAKSISGTGVILVKPGTAFRNAAGNVYEINPVCSEDYTKLAETIKLNGVNTLNIIYLWANKELGTAESLKDLVDTGVYPVLYTARALMEQKVKSNIRLLYAYSTDGEVQPQYAAVSALMKTLHLENPQFGCRIVELRGLKAADGDSLADILVSELKTVGDGDDEVLYDGENRSIKVLRETDVSLVSGTAADKQVFRDGGTYLITGGAGGLGLIFAEHIAKTTKAKIILTGRSELTTEKRNKLDALKASGAEAVYMQSDIADRRDVKELVSKVKEKYGEINGVIHCAGVTRDSLAIKKTVKDMEDVLAPKLYGTMLLDEATATEPLDFFAMFSSFSAVSGNIGQCDYAYANSFMDHFAQMRESLREKGMRRGKSLSVNWPLWREGGMQVGKETEELLFSRAGLVPMSKECGISVFGAAIGLPYHQLIPLQGDKARITAAVGAGAGEKAIEPESAAKMPEDGERERIKEKLDAYLKDLLSKEIKLPASRISSSEPLERYGIDSVVTMSMTRMLEKDFGELPKTLFFEYKSLAELAVYFTEKHPATVMKKFGETRRVESPGINLDLAASGRGTMNSGRKRFATDNAQPEINKGEYEEIAIIGISGRYPMAGNLDEFWENLKKGRDCITEIPKDRWDYRDYFNPDRSKEGSVYSKWGGFIDDVDKFDPLFFNISPREAKLMDPQERLFLQTVWHTLENAGYTRQELAKAKVGVFVGVMYGQYQLLGACSAAGNVGIPASSYASVANRVSYYFDFSGPSMAVDTMCSSSLTAIHLACKSIQSGECDMAVAGGVNVTIHPNKYILLTHGKFASSDGRCRSFGDGGDGYVPGEGAGAVLLKPLRKAVADGDYIHGIIKGSALNHGGKTNGYSVPNPNAQAEVILEAIQKAKVDPGKITYLEAHGTGTALGDPIEIAGLAKAYGRYTNARQYCAIGSVKSNIGHLESAAGIAGLTKVLLQMRYKTLVPSIHSEALNPNINFTDTPFYVQRGLTEWKRPAGVEEGKEIYYPRLAGISSFGAGGANAHIILQEWDNNYTQQRGDENREHIVVLSSKNEERLREYAGALAAYLRKMVDAGRRGEIEGDTLRRLIVRDLLGIAAGIISVDEEDIHADEELSQIGFDAVKISRFVQEISIRFAISIKPDICLEYPTVTDLATYMETEYGNAIAGHYSHVKARSAENDVSFTLGNIAYTLQTGREAMEERLALVVKSIDDLTDKLERFAGENLAPEEAARGNVKGTWGRVAFLLEDEDGREIIEKWIQKGRIRKLAELWAGGIDINWKLLPWSNTCRRIPLPQYPFARERYWFSEPGKTPQGQESCSEAEVRTTTVTVTTPAAAAIQEESKKKFVESKITESLSDVLQVENLHFDKTTPFTDFGVDSVLAVEIINRLNEKLSISLRTTDIFNYSTISSFRDHILKDFGESLSLDATDIAGGYACAEGTGVAAPTGGKPEEAADKDSEGTTGNYMRFYAEKPGHQKRDTWTESSADIAIIGMSACFPEAKNLKEFWDNLREGRDSVKEITRWETGSFYSTDRSEADKSYCRHMGCLADIDKFDPLFFNISPKEAEMMDPQQRLFLMEAWKAIEDAGYSDISMSGKRCGVFVGCGPGDYADGMKKNKVKPEAYAFMGNDESILASRISYFLNLKGPSVAVNTACSSSLVAVHLACESIRCGTSDIALAGGAAVLTTPGLHVMASRAGMLSPDGKCKAFDNDANGFVPGEGIGVVVLKKYEDAVKDGDHIYAVIKGSGINQDGKTNGITAPSAQSQTELELEVYKRCNISPDTIGYVETHGTGTKLGDPIEVCALTDAFGEYTNRKQYCAIGSVKSNIGHTLTAAGIAGLIKAVLCLKHRQLVPSLHMKKANEHIDFENSPFYVNTSLREWKTEAGTPRRAAVSSFGFSGTNAHVVIEEATEPASAGRSRQPWYFIPVSAKNKASFDRKLRELLEWLRTEGYKHEIKDIAYTLHIGRSHFTVRGAFISKNTEELSRAIQEVLEKGHADNYCHNVLNVEKPDAEPGLKELGERLIAELAGESPEENEYREKLRRLAELYANGCELDWTGLYSKERWRRIPLPAYPFNLIRCWYNEAAVTGGEKNTGLVPAGNADQALSQVKQGLVCRKSLTNTDPVIRDHRVKGRLILPGAAYLEMAYSAAKQVRPGSAVCLERVVWLQPLELNGDEMDIRVVIKETGGGMRYEILGEGGNNTIYSKGEISIGNAYSPWKLDVEEIKARCGQILNADRLYASFLDIGLEYGPYFRGVNRIWCGKEEALGLLTLPEGYENEADIHALYPALVDGALQTIAGIKAGNEKKDMQVMLPFSVERVEVLKPLKAQTYAYVKTIGRDRFDIALLDETGRVCARLNDIAFRKVKEAEHPLLYYAPVWKRIGPPQPGTSGDRNGKILIMCHPQCAGLETALAEMHSPEKVVKAVLCDETMQCPENEFRFRVGDAAALDSFIAQFPEIDTIYYLGGISTANAVTEDLEALDQDQEYGVMSLFRLVKALSKNGYASRPLRMKVVTNDVFRVVSGEEGMPCAGSIHGLVKSMAKEFPRWEVCCMDISLKDARQVSDMEGIRKLAKQIAAEPGNPNGDEVAIRDGMRYIRHLEPVMLPPVAGTPFRHKGVYMILGGAGGIGLELSLYLAETVKARLALLGRSPLNEAQKAKISEIRSRGGEVLYIQADASSPESMKAAVNQVRTRFGEINGVIHSAIVLQDRILENMDEQIMRAALAPKVRGSMVLYEVVREEKLDFMMFFSSVQSFSGNAGQGNYAAACTFKDAFASYLAGKVQYPVKVINWGYWGSVGVVATEKYNRLLSSKGVGSIQPAEGMEAVKRILGNKAIQVIPFKADPKLLETMGIDTARRLEYNPKGMDVRIKDVIKEEMAPAIDTGKMILSQQAFTELRSFGERLLLKAFRDMGAFLKRDEKYDLQELMNFLGIIPSYERLHKVLIEIMVRSGFAEIDGNCLAVTAAVEEAGLKRSLENLENEKARLLENYPDIISHVNLLWICMGKYPEILRGKIQATEVMFPNSSMELVEGIYKGNVVADYYNDIVAWSLKSYIEAAIPQLARDEKICILEVGAGTGGTSARVFDSIRRYGDRITYIYTDISVSFTRYGKMQYGKDNPYVEFKTLNIEKDIREQGYRPGSCDVLVATNVLHATRYIQATLKNMKELLKTNGWVVINETTAVNDFATLTFGLLEGWWLYSDKENRLKSSPLLSTSSWNRVLSEEGFEQVHIIGGRDSGQSVIIGESNGLVSRKGNPADIAACGNPAGNKEPVDDEVPAPGKDATIREQVIDNAAQNGYADEDLSQYITDRIAESLIKVLGISADDIDIEKPFSSYGVDSISGLDLINSINKAIGIVLRTTVLFDYGTIKDLAQFICNEYGGQISDNLNLKNEDGQIAGNDDEIPAEDADNVELLQKLADGELNIDDVISLWR
ncbi:MAG: SDR family NAD(P)-dependent oxidoreductase [Acetivibrionales bacterium]|jgi:acyl transferase domain-containing protein/ubiquinone/menaquinone biosynthesis C-methylase UbiE/aryl carrier-like protein